MRLFRPIIAFFLFTLIIISCKDDPKKYTESIGSQGDVKYLLKNDTLTAFMMGGVYTFQGYGGADKTFGLIKAEMKKSPGDDGFATDLEKVYEKLFEYPFHISPKEKLDSRNVLKSWWDISNEHEFHLLLTQLQDQGHEALYEKCKAVLDANGGMDADLDKIDYAKDSLTPDAKILLQFIKNNYRSFNPSGIKAWDLTRYINVVCLGYSAEYIDRATGINYALSALKSARAVYPNWNKYYYDFVLGRKFWGGDTATDATYQKLTTDMQKGDYSLYRYLPLK